MRWCLRKHRVSSSVQEHAEGVAGREDQMAWITGVNTKRVEHAEREVFLRRSNCGSVRNPKTIEEHAVINTTRFVLIQFVALSVVVTMTVTFCRDATAEDDVGLFPQELVKFQPIETNPIFQGRGKGHWDEHIRERGWILRDGNTWHMWYTGFEGHGGIGGPQLKLGYASSSDGLHWKRHPDNPVYDQRWVEDMMVVKHDGTYYMIAEGKHDIAEMLTSPDGIRWTRVGPLDIRMTNGEPISAGPRGTPTVWFEDGTWYLFYERRDLGIWLATSKDTKVWKNVSDDPVIELGPDEYDARQVALNQIIKHQGIY